jgi:hypothetical protein
MADLPFDDAEFEDVRRNVILNDGRKQFLDLIDKATPEEAWGEIKAMDIESLRWIVMERLWTFKVEGGPIHEGDWEIDWPDVP